MPRGECYNPRWNGRAKRGVAPGGSRILDSYELHIQGDFAAAHRLREYDGNCERLHGHNWKVEVYLRGRELDRLGLLIDFREARRLLREAIEPFDHQCLNDLAAFRDTNPTTETIARLVYEAISARLPLACPDAAQRGLAVARVVAWESEGCGASYSKEDF